VGSTPTFGTPAAIFALNLFLGWTLIGWGLALVLALWNDDRPECVADSESGDTSTQRLRRELPPAPGNWLQRQLNQSSPQRGRVLQ
jgi:Superinfection immunity protein